MIGVEVRINWLDIYMVSLRVRAANGRFAGEVELYAAHDVFARLADTFRGFPRSTKDSRMLELGAFHPEYAGGGARFVLRCIDNLGSAVLEIYLRSDSHGRLGRPETADFIISVEAAAIDEFVATLDQLTVEVGATAVLRRAIKGEASDTWLDV